MVKPNVVQDVDVVKYFARKSKELDEHPVDHLQDTGIQRGVGSVASSRTTAAVNPGMPRVSTCVQSLENPPSVQWALRRRTWKLVLCGWSLRSPISELTCKGYPDARDYRFRRDGPSAVSITNAASSAQRTGDGLNSSRISSAVLLLKGPFCPFFARRYAATARRTTGSSTGVMSMLVT